MATPSVSSISPSSGSSLGGTSVTISGSSFEDGCTATIGGLNVNGLTFVSDTTLTGTAPSGMSGARDVVVTNPGFETGTLQSGFTYIGPPTVGSCSPNSGTIMGGQSITITGTDFMDGAYVTIGGNSASGVSVTGATSITCNTPQGVNPGGLVNVRVTNPDTQYGESAQYTYTLSSPTFSSISPNSGPTAGSQSVTITGTDFIVGAAVAIGWQSASDINVSSSTTITCTTPMHDVGAVDVVVTNPAPDSQQATGSGAYTYTHPAPFVDNVEPSSGSVDGGDEVVVHGTGFRDGATVTFGGSSATGVSVQSSTTINCTTPAHAAGPVDVVVTNDDAQTDTLTNGYTYTAGGGVGSTATLMGV